MLVTGAARGMGEAHVRGLVARGAKVLATDVLDEEGRALANALGPAVAYTHLDISNEQQWQQAVSLAESVFGPIRHLVNNAGILTYGTVENLEPSVWRKTLEVNLTGTFLGMHYTVPSIRRANGGSIVNVSSIAGLIGYANLGAYCASKWGIRGITKVAALELGPLGIRVNSIHPGPIRTPMIGDVNESVAAEQPIARVGEPEEVTQLLLYLLTEATYCTGHEFVIDGGAIVGRVVPEVANR